MLSLPRYSIVKPFVLWVPSHPDLGREGWEWNGASIIPGEVVSNLLLPFSNYLDTHRSMGPDGIHPRVLRDLAEELPEPLSTIYQQSWLTRGGPGDRNSTIGMPTYKKEDPGN